MPSMAPIIFHCTPCKVGTTNFWGPPPLIRVNETPFSASLWAWDPVGWQTKCLFLVDLLFGEEGSPNWWGFWPGTEEIHFIARFLLLRMVSWRKNHGKFLEIPLDMIRPSPFPEAQVRASALLEATSTVCGWRRISLQSLPTPNLVCFLLLARLSPGVANLYIKTVPFISLTFLIISSVLLSKHCARYVACRDRALCSSVTMKQGEQVLRCFVERPPWGRSE